MTVVNMLCYFRGILVEKCNVLHLDYVHGCKKFRICKVASCCNAFLLLYLNMMPEMENFAYASWFAYYSYGRNFMLQI